MNTYSQQSRTRSILGAACLSLGFVLFAATDLLSPYDAAGDDLVTVARNQVGALTAYSLTWLLGSLLMVAGAATAVGRIRGRGAGLALAGGTLAGAGAVAGAAIGAFESLPISLAEALPDDATLDAALKSFDNSIGLGILFLTLVIGTAIGWPMLIGAAARADLLSRWFVPVAAVGIVGTIAVSGSAATTPSLVASAVLLVPILALARAIALRDIVTEESLAPADAGLLDTIS